MNPLDSSNPARRRYAALLLDIETMGGSISGEDLAFRASLYGLGDGHLGKLMMNADPAVIRREPSGWWGLTPSVLTILRGLQGGGRKELERAASPWAE